MLSSTRSIRLGYVLASAMLFLSFFLIYSVTRRLEYEKASVVDSQQIIRKVLNLELLINNVELNIRNYMGAGKGERLDDFERQKMEVSIQMNDLIARLNEDTALNQQLRILHAVFSRRMSDLTQLIDRSSATTPNFVDSVLTKDRVQQLDSIQVGLHTIADWQAEHANKRVDQLSTIYSITEIIIYLSLLIAIAATLYALLTLNTHYNKRKKSDEHAIEARQALERSVLELSQKNAELKQFRGIEKFAAIGRVARVMAHEVRNPLTNISLATQQLQEISGVEKDQEANFLLAMISRNANRINQMVSDLLNATKYIQLEIRKEDVNQVLEESLYLAKDRLSLRKIELKKRYAPDICDVMVDKERLKIALLNIIINSIEAMEEKEGILQVTTKMEEGKCIIEISDNGKGMSEETLHNIFEPYFSMKKKGGGLGLTNAQNIIISHKGTIKVNSIEGAGTTFIVTLESDLSGWVK